MNDISGQGSGVHRREVRGVRTVIFCCCPKSRGAMAPRVLLLCLYHRLLARAYALEGTCSRHRCRMEGG